MRSIGNKALLLLKAPLQPVEHVIDGQREFRKLVFSRRYLDAPVHALHFNLARCLRQIANGFQNTPAEEISRYQC